MAGLPVICFDNQYNYYIVTITSAGMMSIRQVKTGNSRFAFGQKIIQCLDTSNKGTDIKNKNEEKFFMLEQYTVSSIFPA